MNQSEAQERRGVGYALAAYGLWGLFPLYFTLLHRSGPVEIVLHRILWSLLVCLGAVAVMRRWDELRAPLRSARTVAMLTTAAAMLLGALGLAVSLRHRSGGTVGAASR